MPVKIQDIYDEINTILAAELPEYMRFPNPYVIDANTFIHMKSGYGVSIGPGVDTERYLGCLVTWQRDFTITLVRQVLTTQNNLALREGLEKEILEDHDKIRKAIYNNSTLSGKAIKTTATGDGGVSFIDGDRLKFLAMEILIVTEYEESPT